MPRYYNGYGGYPPPMGYDRGLGVRGVLIITAIILALVIGIFIYAKLQAKKDIAGQLPADYKEGTTAAESEQIRSFSTSLQADLEGFSSGHDYDLYRQMLQQTDVMFKNVCIDYKRLTTRSLKADFVSDAMGFRFMASLSEDLYGKMLKAFDRNAII